MSITSIITTIQNNAILAKEMMKKRLPNFTKKVFRKGSIDDKILKVQELQKRIKELK